MVSGVGPLLIAAVAGYWVLERADTHKGRLRSLGRFLGGLIIVVSLVGVACRVWCMAAGGMGYCPVGKSGKGWYSPYRSQTPSSEPSAQ